jgi:hypothetical protein
MPKYVLCPRCELNYIKEGEEYCDVCKAELKKGPQLVFAVDDEDEQEVMELCPKCHQNYLKPGQTLCRQCAKLSQYEDEKTVSIFYVDTYSADTGNHDKNNFRSIRCIKDED